MTIDTQQTSRLEVSVDWAPAYELLVSFLVFAWRGKHVLIDLGQGWIDDVRFRLPSDFPARASQMAKGKYEDPLLTLLVRVLLFPLNRVQQSSMQRYGAAMQRLKPQLDALKAKYKNNMRKYNEEQMQLLKAEGVRPPLGGCLLIFLQFPIWVSLFQVLRSNIELRHAPFMFWVHDLSSPDRMPFPIVGTIHLLPILMAAAQVIQMRLQPKPADDSQAQMQRMMGFMMPIVMLLFLYKYPSGLALYIFTSSLFGIAEYQIVKRLWPVPVVAPVAAKGKKS